MWIECKIGFQDRVLSDLDIHSNDAGEWVDAVINTDKLASISKYVSDDGEPDENLCYVWFSDGESIMIEYPFEKLKRLIVGK